MQHSHFDLIEEIFGAAIDPERWPSVVRKIEKEFNSPSAGVFTQNLLTNEFRPVLLTGIEEEYLESYGEYYAKINPWYALNLTAPGYLVTDQTVDRIKGDTRAFGRTEFCNDWMQRQGYRYAMGLALVAEGNQLINFWFQRSQSAGCYTKQEQEDYKRISKFLAQAIEISRRLEHVQLNKFAAASVLERLKTGVVMLSHDMRVIYCNPHAETMMEEEKLISYKGNKFSCVVPKYSEKFSLWLEEITQTQQAPLESFRIMGENSSSGISVLATPMRSKGKVFSLLDPAVMLSISEYKDSPGDMRHQWQSQYNLTSRECDIAEQLIKGRSLRCVSDILELSYETVRWHLKAIFQKVEVNRQADLVRLLLSSGDL